ncbi:recombinase RecA [Streptomonospora wellingtoniae]
MVAGTRVWTDRGLETVEELFERAGQRAACTSRTTDIRDRGIRAVNERGELETVAALTHNNRKPVLRVTLESGRRVSVTHNHPLRVVNTDGYIVWCDAGDIAPGDTVVSARFGAEEAAAGDGLSEDEAVFLGYLAAGGTLGDRYSLRFTDGDPEVGAEFSAIAGWLLDAEVREYGGRNCTEYVVSGKAVREHVAAAYGLDYCGAAEKSVPYRVRTAGDKAQRAFLSALFEGDGWIDTSSTVGLGSASEQLAREVQLMLYGLGVPASLHSDYNAEYARTYWSVIVNPTVTHRFLEEVGFRSARRAAQVERNFRMTLHNARLESIPNLSGLVRSLRDAVGGDRRFDEVAGDLIRTDMDLPCGRETLRNIVRWADDRPHLIDPATRPLLDYLRHLAATPYTYEAVTAVEDGGLQPTFDLMLPDTHSFVAEGMLSHNTTVALHAVASAQKSGGIAAFIDAEHALDPEYAKKIGVNTDDLLLSQPDTGEQALEIADMLIRSGAVSILVVDSVAALVPRAEIEGEMGDSHVGLQARLMSQALRKIAGALHQTGTTAVFINQLREKVGVMFGSPETTTGGRALKFYSSVRLDVRRIETLKDGTDAVGNRTRVKVVKNKVAPPFKQAEFDILYGVGISREGGLIDLGVEQGVVRKSGAWYTYEGTQLGQGKENARNFLRENVDMANEIEKKIKEKLGVPGAGDDSAESAATADAKASDSAKAAGPKEAGTKEAAVKETDAAASAAAPAKRASRTKSTPPADA